MPVGVGMRTIDLTLLHVKTAILRRGGQRLILSVDVPASRARLPILQSVNPAVGLEIRLHIDFGRMLRAVGSFSRRVSEKRTVVEKVCQDFHLTVDSSQNVLGRKPKRLPSGSAPWRVCDGCVRTAI